MANHVRSHRKLRFRPLIWLEFLKNLLSKK